jgi:hypothetical protein
MTPLEPEPVVPYDQSIELNVLFDTLGNGVNYAMFNQISYTAPIVPTLLTVFSSPANYTTDPTIYGDYTNPEVLGHNNVVQIVLNNGDTGKHPCTRCSSSHLTTSSPAWAHVPSGLSKRGKRRNVQRINESKFYRKSHPTRYHTNQASGFPYFEICCKQSWHLASTLPAMKTKLMKLVPLPHRY